MISIRIVFKKVWLSNVVCPGFKFVRGHQLAFFVVRVQKPDKLILLKKIAAHLRPLCLKLETIIICVVSDHDVLIPHDRISNMTIEFVLFLSAGQMSSLSGGVANEKWGDVPFDFAEEVLGLGDVDVGRNIVGERIEGRSNGHGAAQQLAINLRRKTDDGRCVIYGYRL